MTAPARTLSCVYLQLSPWLHPVGWLKNTQRPLSMQYFRTFFSWSVKVAPFALAFALLAFAVALENWFSLSLSSSAGGGSKRFNRGRRLGLSFDILEAAASAVPAVPILSEVWANGLRLADLLHGRTLQGVNERLRELLAFLPVDHLPGRIVKGFQRSIRMPGVRAVISSEIRR